MTDPGDETRVLHVDADEDVLEAATTCLEDAEPGLVVHTATSPEAGLRELERTDVDCVVSDHRPPTTDGLALLRDVRDLDPGVAFVLFTGEGDEALASEAISAGVTDYVPKGTATEQYDLLASAVVDAAGRRRVETAREGGHDYRQLLDRIHDGVFVRRGDAVTLVNDRFCRITGYDREHVLSTGVLELVHPDDRERLREYAERRRRGDTAPSLYRARIVTADGETRRLEFGVATTTVDGEYAAVCSVRDVTDRRRHENRLAEFAGIVSHDLRNPLNVIAGRVQMARDTGEDTHFDAISRGVDSLDELITDMRTLADYGVPVDEPEVVDVRSVAEAARAKVDASDDGDSTPGDTDGEGPTVTIAEGLGRIEADPDRLERLFVELFENALVHGSPPVRLEPTDAGFAVADNGPGIDELDRDRVFESGYTHSTERTGFGLTVVDWTAEAHGWSVHLARADGPTRVEVTGVTRL